jgi:hypothetical protein
MTRTTPPLPRWRTEDRRQHPVVVAWNRQASGQRIRRRRSDASSIARTRRRSRLVVLDDDDDDRWSLRTGSRRWREEQSFCIARQRRVLRVRHLLIAAEWRPVVRCPAAPPPRLLPPSGGGDGGGGGGEGRAEGSGVSRAPWPCRCRRLRSQTAHFKRRRRMRASWTRIVAVPPPPPGRSRFARRWGGVTAGRRRRTLGWKCRRHVGDMSATREYVANFRSDMPIPATRFSCVGTLLCRDFSDIDVPRTDDILYVGKYIDLSMYDTRLLKRYVVLCVVFLFDDNDDDDHGIRRADTARALAR